MRSLYLSAGILLLSLGGAWMRFTAEPDKIGDNEVLVMANQADRISSITWTSETQDVYIERRTDALGPYLWVQYTDKKNPETVQEKYFQAGPNGEKLLNNLSPLLGIRKLESDVALDSIGLTTPTASLKVISNGQTRTFSIGDEAYGTRDLYVKDDQSNEVFLVDDTKLRNLRQARTSLPDRSLWSANVSNITQASLEFQSQRLPLTRQNWQDRNKAAWIFTEDATKDATQIETWIGKLLRVSVSQYAKPDEDLSTLTPVFSCTFTWDDDGQDTVTFYQHSDESWWAETAHTRGKVKIAGSALNGLVDDLPSLFSNLPNESSPTP
jgi:hypothetical protein